MGVLIDPLLSYKTFNKYVSLVSETKKYLDVTTNLTYTFDFGGLERGGLGVTSFFFLDEWLGVTS